MKLMPIKILCFLAFFISCSSHDSDNEEHIINVRDFYFPIQKILEKRTVYMYTNESTGSKQYTMVISFQPKAERIADTLLWILEFDNNYNETSREAYTLTPDSLKSALYSLTGNTPWHVEYALPWIQDVRNEPPTEYNAVSIIKSDTSPFKIKAKVYYSRLIDNPLGDTVNKDKFIVCNISINVHNPKNEGSIDTKSSYIAYYEQGIGKAYYSYNTVDNVRNNYKLEKIISEDEFLELKKKNGR